MKCSVMRHFIWVFTVCQSTRLGLSGLQRFLLVKSTDWLFIVTPMWDSVVILCFVVRFFMSFLVLHSSRWGRESWLFCLVCILVSRDCCVALSQFAMGLSAVCDCGSS